jgi:hypothetical protein
MTDSIPYLVPTQFQELIFLPVLEPSMGARNLVGIGLSYRHIRLHRLTGSIPWNEFLVSLIKSLKIPSLHLVTTDEESNADVGIKYLNNSQLQKGLGVGGGTPPPAPTPTFLFLFPNWFVFQCNNNYLMH